MEKAQIADVLDQIATLLELKGENPFKIRAYGNAARSIEAFGGSFATLQDAEALEKIPGIGKAIAAKIKELADTGTLTFFDELRAEFPAGILELFTISGLGAKKVKALWEKLQVSSIAQLQEACNAGRVAELPGFGKTTQEKLCQAIAARVKHTGTFQLGQIAAEAERLQDDLRAHEDALHVCIAGSYRRRKELVRDLDFIVATNEPAALTELFVRHPLVETILAQGPTKSSVRLHSGIQCDLRVVTATASVSQSTCTAAMSSSERTSRWLRRYPIASASGAWPSVISVTSSFLSRYSVSGCSPAIAVGTISPSSL
jgi:DNA polymerase (family 10)